MEKVYVYCGEFGQIGRTILLQLEFIINYKKIYEKDIIELQKKNPADPKIKHPSKIKMKKINIIFLGGCGSIFKYFYPEFFNIIKLKKPLYVKNKYCFQGILTPNNMKLLCENSVIAKDSKLGKSHIITHHGKKKSSRGGCYLGNGCEKYIENNKNKIGKKYILYHILEFIKSIGISKPWRLLKPKIKSFTLYINKLDNVQNIKGRQIIGINFRNRDVGRHRNNRFDKTLIKKIINMFPNYYICLYGYCESNRKKLKYDKILYPSNLEETIYYFNRTIVLLTSHSGLEEVARLWFGLINLIELQQNNDNILYKLKLIINKNKKIMECICYKNIQLRD